MSPLLTKITENTYTVKDLHRRLRLMQQCLESVLYDEPDQMRITPVATRRERAIETLADERDKATLQTLDEQDWNSFTAATLATKMKALLEESEQLPVMTLYLPVAFTDKQLAPLSAWARREVAAGIMFEVLIDPKVVGGCAFVYNGTHFDWSLRRYLRAKRGVITSLLNAYGS